MQPFLRLLPFLAFSTTPLLGLAACRTDVTAVLSADELADADASTPPAACTTAQGCNFDPVISSLRGECVGGHCVCNPGVQTTSDGKCGSPGGVVDGAVTPNDCVAKGGVCANAAPPNSRPASSGEGSCPAGRTCWVPITAAAGPACTNDTGCNEDITISSQMGTCTLGVCVCRSGTYVQPSGRCGVKLPPGCGAQAGTCRQMPATCAAGELGSEPVTNQTCGDFVEAVCCLKTAACKGGGREVPGGGWTPVDFACCMAGRSGPAICVNGWKTCEPGQTPTAGGC